MSNNSNPNYFRLGIFVLAAIGALLTIILIFGSGQLFKKSFTVETYVKQSVTGLDAGAAVRFRGVRVGQVTQVELTGDIYEQDVPVLKHKEYVVVRMQIYGKSVSSRDMEELIKSGLRARIKSMGITGVNYVEFGIANNAEDYQALPYSWNAKYPVIPSMPNQTDEIIAGIQSMVQLINKLDIKDTQQNINLLISNFNKLIAGDGKENTGLTNSVKDLNVLLDRIAKVTDKDQLNILMRELVATMVSLRQTVTSVQGDTTATLENIRQASEQLNEFTRVASQSPSTLIWGEPPARITPPMNGAQK